MLDGRTVLLLAAVCVVLAGLAWWRWCLRRHAYLNYRQSSQYSRGTFANTPPTAALHRRGTLAALLRMALYPQRYRPTQPLSVQRPDWDAFLHDDGEARIKMIWFGHSSLLMRVGGKTVFFDPVFAPSVSPLPWMMLRFQAAPAALHELPPVDYVVYSHNHYDHLDKTAFQHFAATATQFIVPLGMAALLRSWGAASEGIHEADWWDEIALDGWQLHAVPARHNSGRGWGDTNLTLWNGWVVRTQSESIYYSGDSSYGSHFAEIGKRFGGLDLALIENGQYNPAWRDNHMFPEQTVQAALDVRAKCLMPVHWGAYALSTHPWDEPVCRSVPLARHEGLAVLTPVQGQVFNRLSETSCWWENSQS